MYVRSCNACTYVYTLWMCICIHMYVATYGYRKVVSNSLRFAFRMFVLVFVYNEMFSVHINYWHS